MEQTLKQRRKGFIAMLLVFLMVFESLPMEVLATDYKLGNDGNITSETEFIPGTDTVSWNGDLSVEYYWNLGDGLVAINDINKTVTKTDGVSRHTISTHAGVVKWTANSIFASGGEPASISFKAVLAKYNVTFNMNGHGGAAPSGQEVEYMHKAAAPSSPTDANYTFGGWYKTGACNSGNEWDFDNDRVTSDTVLYAKWTANNCTIRFINDGTVISSAQYPKGTLASQIAVPAVTPTRASTDQYDYSFSGWSPALENVTRDMDYYAQYNQTLRTYTVTWNNDDGSALETDQNVPYGTTPTYDGETPAKAATVSETFTFTGWTPDVGPITGDTVYTATYDSAAAVYTITWLDDDGKTIDTTRAAYGDLPTHTDPSKAATAEYTYTFSGWSPEIVPVAGDATYTATYSAVKNKYTITWLNDAGEEIDKEELEYGVVPSHDAPVKESTKEYTYTFDGWDPTPVAVTGDATYKAKFTEKRNKYKVTWLDYDGTILGTQKYSYGATPTFADPSRPADDKYEYVFTGWSPAIRPVTSNATYIAQYDAKTLVGAGDKDPSSDSDNSSSRVKNVAQQVNTNNASGTPVKSPQTGGENPMRTAAMAVLLLSSTATAALIIRRRRRQNTK